VHLAAAAVHTCRASWDALRLQQGGSDYAANGKR